MEHLQRQWRSMSAIGAAMVIATGAVAAVSAHAFTKRGLTEAEICYSEESSALGVVENFLSPANGSMVAAGTSLTFSSDSSQPLSFAIASSEALLSTPNVDSGPGSPSPPPPNAAGAGTQHYSFTSTKATGSAGTVYWQASFSSAALPHCADYAHTEKTAVRTLTVLSPSSSEAEADAKKKQEEEAAEKKKQEEAAANKKAHKVSGSVSLDGATINVGRTHEAIFKLTCAGTATCSGKLTLTRSRTNGKGKHKHTKTDTIGTTTFSIPAGKSTAVALKLNAAGGALLSAGHGRLDASLTVVTSSPAPSQTHTETVHLVKQKPHGKTKQ
jgi:hypothetical protein